MTKTMPRRQFVRLSLGAAGSLVFWPELAASRLARAAAPEPHFFLQVVFQTGLDPTYLFDARPLAMTAAGVIQNYLGEEPRLEEGGDAWVTRLTDPLRPHRADFSVLNGVVMATAFDGHDQNLNYLMAGDPFGGESFVPHLNAGALPLDAVQSGSLFATLSNTGATVPLARASAVSLVERLRKTPPLDETSNLFAFIRGRMRANAGGPGSFSGASRVLAEAYGRTPAFSRQIQSLEFGAGAGESPEADFLALAMPLFKQRIARSAILVTGANFDAHDVTTARNQPATIGAAAAGLARIFKTLRETPFDAGRSFLDVTTVMAASEFGRTLRQTGRPIDETGTDHNPLTNSVLLGGKGIRGGRIIGASDTRAAGETLSGAHRAFDPASLKMMGRPFDFATGRPRADLPAAYDPADYLGMGSVANSVYSLFGVPTDRHRKLSRNGPAAKVVPGLLRDR